MAADQSVAIVGGAPIGLALALHLDMYGVSSTVFNTEAETRWHLVFHIFWRARFDPDGLRSDSRCLGAACLLGR